MSDTIELDFGDVKEFAPRAKGVKKGDYLMRVEKIQADTSKAGNPMWIVDSAFVDGPHEGEQIREYMALTEKALFKVYGFLQAVKGQQIPKKKVKLPNTSPALMKKFGGKVFGAHVDDGDPYTDDNGNEIVPSEIKYHLFARDVEAKRKQKAQTKEEVTASTPEDDEEPDTDEAEEETSEETEGDGDVADQLESFDLDDL